MDEKRVRPDKTATEFNRARVYEFVLANGRIPTVPEVASICNCGYDYAARFRRRVLKEFPSIDIETIVEEVKKLLLDRLKTGKMDNASLVRMLPWIAPRCEGEEGERVELTHKFVVVKPTPEVMQKYVRSHPELYQDGGVENVEVETEDGDSLPVKEETK